MYTPLLYCVYCTVYIILTLESTHHNTYISHMHTRSYRYVYAYEAGNPLIPVKSLNQLIGLINGHLKETTGASLPSLLQSQQQQQQQSSSGVTTYKMITSSTSSSTTKFSMSKLIHYKNLLSKSNI